MNLSSSPWGAVKTQKQIAPGIVSVTTSSHGGIKVIPELWEKMKVKETAFSRGGWFEEDCDWALVALSFPEHFNPEDIAVARATLKNIYGGKYLSILEETL